MKQSITFNASIEELFHAISVFFERSRTAGTLIQFLDESESVIVELLINNKTPKQLELRTGTKCTPATFDKVKSAIDEAITESTPSVSRSIIFCDEPIDGYFRYGDDFQILPPPDDAPKPRYNAEGPHPMRLEFSFDKSSNEVINNYRISKKTFELSSLLNLFLNRRVWTRDFTFRKGWVWCDDEKVTKLCTLLYGYNFSPSDKYSDFTETKNYRLISSVEPSAYYHFTSNLYNGRSLEVPSNLNELLDIAFRNSETHEELLNITKLFSVASKLWDSSETAAYLSTVNTIESIVEKRRSKSKRCKTCNKELEGPTKAFKGFIEKYTTKSDDELIEKIKKNIYTTRSRITHGGLLLGNDQQPYWIQLDQNSYKRSLEEGRVLRCLVREAIINWLTDTKKRE